MQTFKVKEEYIKLGQLLKAAGMVSSGIEAKLVILEGRVLVNGSEELRRGKKLYPEDVISYQGEEIKIIS